MPVCVVQYSVPTTTTGICQGKDCNPPHLIPFLFLALRDNTGIPHIRTKKVPLRTPCGSERFTAKSSKTTFNPSLTFISSRVEGTALGWKFGNWGLGQVQVLHRGGSCFRHLRSTNQTRPSEQRRGYCFALVKGCRLEISIR